MTTALGLRTREGFPVLDRGRRDAIARLPRYRAAHAKAFAELDFLDDVECRPPRDPAAALGPRARVAFWNAERCKFVAPAAALLERTGADVTLLCELDVGMARSGQRHTLRDLARHLGQGYAFAIEYLELGLGDAAERARHAGADNAVGYHGAALFSCQPLHRPAVLRLEADGAWFDGERGERRLGGRMAILGTVALGGVGVTFACVHLEGHAQPAMRAAQMENLLAGIEAYAPGAPVVIGGDFNTATASRAEINDPAAVRRLLAEDVTRFVDPVPHEPLFRVADRAGYAWAACNVAGEATDRKHERKTMAHERKKIDWFFCRGVAPSEPAVVPARDADRGFALSDHELIALTIRTAPGAGETAAVRRAP